MRTVNLEQLREAVLAEVAKEGDDFVYEPIVFGAGEVTGCRNTHQGKGSCLLGRALVNQLGVPIEWFGGSDAGNELNASTFDTVCFRLKNAGLLNVSSPAVTWGCCVQRGQDGQHPWGQCVKNADKHYGKTEAEFETFRAPHASLA